MNEDDEVSQQVVPNPWVRWLVVGLPFGLLFMGALSFVFYFQKRNAAREIQPSRLSTMMRKDLNLEEYRRYVKVLSKDIGPRTPDQPGNVEAAQSFIQSTLGYDNMGYDMVRRELDKNVAFEAGLPGAKSPKQLVLVCARYDGNNAEAISSLFVLAHALTGSTHRNNIRFFALDGSGGDSSPSNGAGSKMATYGQWNSKEEFSGMATLYLAGRGESPSSLGGKLVLLSAPAPDDPAALESLRKLQEMIEQYGDAGVLK